MHRRTPAALGTGGTFVLVLLWAQGEKPAQPAPAAALTCRAVTV